LGYFVRRESPLLFMTKIGWATFLAIKKPSNGHLLTAMNGFVEWRRFEL
jgi:hypothetical protein